MVVYIYIYILNTFPANSQTMMLTEPFVNFPGNK